MNNEQAALVTKLRARRVSWVGSGMDADPDCTAAADMIEALAAPMVTGWQPIATAPKDGTRVVLWRGAAGFGKWNDMVVAQWFDDAWRWPDMRDNPSTHGHWTDEEMWDGYEDNKSFTHWMPLLAPPAA